MTTPYPEPLDDDGNINVHALGSFAGAPFAVREDGRIVDISATPLFFEIPVINFRRAFAPHPTDAKARWFPPMTKAECAAVPMDGAAYVIFDETGGGRADLFGALFMRYN